MQDKAVNLADLVWQWIQDHPVLKEHLTISRFDDGFYLETKCSHYTIAWFDCDNLVTVGPSASIVVHQKDRYYMQLDPADPTYFTKLEEYCRLWHNAYSSYYTTTCTETL